MVGFSRASSGSRPIHIFRRVWRGDPKFKLGNSRGYAGIRRADSISPRLIPSAPSGHYRRPSSPYIGHCSAETQIPNALYTGVIRILVALRFFRPRDRPWGPVVFRGAPISPFGFRRRVRERKGQETHYPEIFGSLRSLPYLRLPASSVGPRCVVIRFEYGNPLFERRISAGYADSRESMLLLA